LDNGEQRGRFWSWVALVVGVGIWITGGITFGGSFVLTPAGVLLTLVAMRWSRRDTVFWIAFGVNAIDVLIVVAFFVPGALG
jgi:hypothetical protein